VRVRFAPNAVPPTLEIVTQRPRAEYPQPVLFPNIINFNDGAHWEKAERLKN
jgi:hypothetical protein